MPSTMPVHMPVHNTDHKHFVLVIDTVPMSKEFEGIMVSITIKAGIYGFTSKENRDSFASLLNRLDPEKEVAFIAVI